MPRLFAICALALLAFAAAPTAPAEAGPYGPRHYDRGYGYAPYTYYDRGAFRRDWRRERAYRSERYYRRQLRRERAFRDELRFERQLRRERAIRRELRRDRFERRAYRRWRLGYPLPRDLRFRVIHDYRYYGLGPPPRGAFYAAVDSDLLLIAQATRDVVSFLGILDELSRR